jgi:NADPH-dependent 2,4-dienoyl-CoA reductase/sulfur reductase-like enzyme
VSLVAAPRVLIVGASLAAVTVAERLRERGSDASVTIVGDEELAPYDRPPLSKQRLASAPSTSSAGFELRPAAWFRERDIDLRLGTRALSLHADRLEVAVDKGQRLRADHVVVATGARARRMERWGRPSGLHYLRTAQDSDALRSTLRSPGRLVIVGGGFIGLEVASAAVVRGWDVCVVEMGSAPLGRVLPAEVAELCIVPLRARGVRFLCGQPVQQVHADGGVTAVELADGHLLPADAVVVGAGAAPNVEWLAGSGVDVGPGVVCDGLGRTTREGVWALGDVAQWPNLTTGRSDRVEQWQAARDQGRVVADAILGDRTPWNATPYFWSDLLDEKVQFVGWASSSHRSHTVSVRGRAVCLIGDEKLRGVLTVSSPRHLAAGRRLLMSATSFEDAREWADRLPTAQIAS